MAKKLEIKPIVSEIKTTIKIEEEKLDKKKLVEKLSVGFPNEDMNQVVAKLNEVIDKIND